MKIRYSKEDDAIYIRFTDELIDHSDPLNDDFILDYSSEGDIVGMEVLSASTHAQIHELIVQAINNVSVQQAA